MTIKRGTIREDGRIFNRYRTGRKNIEEWITPKAFERSRQQAIASSKRNRTLEKDKAKREKYREQRIAYGKKWRESNPNLCREYDKRTKSKFKDDPIFKLKSNYRRRLSQAIKERKLTRKSKTPQIIGCAWEDFKCHLEAQFTEGMTWENYGIHGWHVDHIRPLALAATEEELMILMHYTNTQPLWATDNLKKGTSIPI